MELSPNAQRLYNDLIKELFLLSNREETIGELKARLFSNYTWEEVAEVQVYLEERNGTR